MIFNKTNRSLGRAVCLLLCAVLMMSLCIGLFTVTSAAAQEKDSYRNMKLIPGGIPFGVKFNTDGVVVIGFCDIDNIEKTQNPAYLAGLRPKDIITEVNGNKITGSSELTKIIEQSDGRALSLTYKRSGVVKKITLTPVFSKSENKYKTGVWVRDTGAGIGTVTFICPDTNEFGGLGHGICDGETGELIPMSRGVVTEVTISKIKKGVSGVPGEIQGFFGSEKKGSVVRNTECGVFGVLTEIPNGIGEAIPVATRDEIRAGEAQIICTLDGGKKSSYKIEISSINRDSDSSKCFIIKIKDSSLIEKTGGIVQGMSGSPIIQNGKLIGAVTHVMVNDPTTGYGIFIENMLNQMGSVKG